MQWPKRQTLWMLPLIDTHPEGFVFRLSPIAYRLSPIAYRLSPIAYRLSPIADGCLTVVPSLYVECARIALDRISRRFSVLS
jgi:hypothetical protein